MIAPARIFCRKAGEAFYYDEATKTHIASGPRTMFGGAAIGNLLRPEVDEDQLVLAQLVIIPRQIYTVKPKSVSPGHGMRMDQILTSGSCLDPRCWDRRLK